MDSIGLLYKSNVSICEILTTVLGSKYIVSCAIMEINQETNLSGTEDNTVLQNMINPAINKTKLQQDKLHKGVYSYVNGEVFACKR